MNSKKNFYLLSAAHFITDVYSSFLTPLMPIIITIFKLTLTQAGYLITTYAVVASVVQPLFGWLSDRIGRKYIIALSPLFAVIFLSLLTSFSNVNLFIMTLILGGMAVSAFHPVGASLAHTLHKNNPGLGMALFIALGTIGTSFGPAYISWIVSRYQPERSFLAAIPGIIFCVIFIFIFKVSAADDKIVEDESKKEQSYPYYLYTLLFIMVVLRSLTQVSLAIYLTIYFHREGYSLMSTGWIVSLMMGMGALGGLLGGALYKRFGFKQLFIYANLFSAIILAFFLRTTNPWTLILLAAGCVMLYLPGPITITIAQDISPRAIGTISAIMMGLGWGVAGMLVPITGYLGDHYGLKFALEMLFVPPFVCIFISLLLPDKQSYQKMLA